MEEAQLTTFDEGDKDKQFHCIHQEGIPLARLECTVQYARVLLQAETMLGHLVKIRALNEAIDKAHCEGPCITAVHDAERELATYLEHAVQPTIEAAKGIVTGRTLIEVFKEEEKTDGAA